LLIILLLLLIQPLTPLLNIVDAHSDGNDDEESDNNDKDFEEEDSIQICCTWGEKIADRILTYNIDDSGATEGQQDAVRNAVEQWDTKLEPLELEEISSEKKSDITFEFQNDNNDKETIDGEGIAGKTMTVFDGLGFIMNAEVAINKAVQGYEFDTNTIGGIAKHEMGHALGLGHANFDGNLMTGKINDGSKTISDCEISAVIAANYWSLNQNINDVISFPNYPQRYSIAC
jgi:hypothetical protein